MGDGGSGSDAKMGIMHVLKPYAGFEAKYQGKGADQWIMVQEGPALDPNAGKPGYPSGLVAALPVVYGSRISLWFPHILTVNANPALVETYRWRWMYRLRNLQEYVTRRGAYHATTILGQSDAGQPRVLKPAAYRAFAVQQAEPAGPPTGAVSDREQFHVRPVDIRPYSGNPPALPINPDGSPGQIQSGVLDGAVFGPVPTSMPTYDAVRDIADGDELLIAVSRDTVTAATYDFNMNGADFRFAKFMSAVDVGVLVFTGYEPSAQSSFL